MLLYAGTPLIQTVNRQVASSIRLVGIPVALFLIMLPWTVFALRYVGRSRLVTQRRIAFAAIVLLTYIFIETAGSLGLLGLAQQQTQSLRTAASVVALAALAVVFTVSLTVVSSASRHDRLSLTHGVVAVLPIVTLAAAGQVTRASTPALNNIVAAGSSIAVAGALWLGISRYDLLSDRPGTGTLGEQAAVTVMDDAVFVVDRQGRIARANTAARETFTVDSSAQIDRILGLEIPELVDSETAEFQTVRGRRQFDPRVTELRNGRDELLGYTLALFDVTDREIRQQRLQVLNRILRHNLRNRLDVIRAHAEQTSNTPIIETADRLDRLSTKARRIETLMKRANTLNGKTHLPTVVDEAVTDIVADNPTTETHVDVPELTLDVDSRLCRYVVTQLVENAVIHNDGPAARVEINGMMTSTGVQLVIADNGPGIPEAEQDVITTGTEDDLAHGSSLGLWGANWAIQTLGGDLSFDTSHLGGAAVRVDLPQN
ncbi:HAMP domain-containing sensor histidine kinase [Halorubrum sp. RMP-47]|uniref:sensor histidine kinase n=1 Tax=Halorubrum miltondacostae TaxID=3076378 RepID=UPI003528E046